MPPRGLNTRAATAPTHTLVLAAIVLPAASDVHVFRSALGRCALAHAAKTKRCFVCAENTGGIFNASKALQEKINRLREREEVEAGGDETDEALLREYAEQKKKTRGYTGGWGLV